MWFFPCECESCFYEEVVEILRVSEAEGRELNSFVAFPTHVKMISWPLRPPRLGFWVHVFPFPAVPFAASALEVFL